MAARSAIFRTQMLGGVPRSAGDHNPAHIQNPGDPSSGSIDQAAAANRPYGPLIGPREATQQVYDGRQPVRLHYAPFVVTFNAVTDAPQMLIPSNQRRCSYQIHNPNEDILIAMSFGQPVGTIVANGNIRPLGVVIDYWTTYFEYTGMTSVDDIWVWPLQITGDADVFPMIVLGYEATLAQEGGDLTLYGKGRGT